MSRRRVLSVFALTVALLFARDTVSVLNAQEAGVLSNLEIGSYKTPIEYLRFPLDQTLSASRFEYTATVSDQYTAKFYITATAPANTETSLTINGAAMKSGEPCEVDLKEGENKFDIAVDSKEATLARYRLTVERRDLSKVYTSEKLGNGIWRVYDFGGTRGDESFYLVEGKDRALVMDTGMGKGDLPAYLRTLTSLPIDVAITHGHGDHFGQVNEFKDSTVYIAEEDASRLPHDFITPKFHYIEDGDVIDLGGGRKFEAVNVPGHTIGSMVYVDRADNIAVTGDALSSGSMVYMFMPSCTALDQYLEGLKHLQNKIEGLDNLTLLVGHAYQEKVPLTGAAAQELVADMRTAAEQVLSGAMEGRQVFNPMRDGKIELREAYVGLAGLWYNPRNLRTSPAGLSFLDLKTSNGQLPVWKPVFASSLKDYSATMPDQSSTVEVTAMPYWPNFKKLAVNGAEVKAGEAHAVQLQPGENKIAVEVTGNDGSTEMYTVAIRK